MEQAIVPQTHLPSMPPPGGRKVTLPDLDWDHMTLDWDQYRDKWELSPDGSYYALRFVYYATRLKSRDHQYMNLYVPAAYLNPDFTVCPEGVMNGYTPRTAPIVLSNDCGGWKSSVPGEADPDYLAQGFVHVSVGARSRGLAGGVGKAPAPCVDQKAAVRMLRLHDGHIPGCKDRIISCGGSGGGQMSSILGATGNMDRYYPDLYAIGAAGIDRRPDGTYVSTIRDDIYASQCYCPIADLDHADLAYAWQRYDDPNITCQGFGVEGRITLSPFQLALQRDLAQAYCRYLNSLKLEDAHGALLSFDALPDGTLDMRSGSYCRAILENLSDALNRWLKDKILPDGSLEYDVFRFPNGLEHRRYPSVQAYLDTLGDASAWITQEDGRYRVTDLRGFCMGTGLRRGKSVPGFDTFHMRAENDAFGTSEEDAVHFAPAIADLLRAHEEEYRALPGWEQCDMDLYLAHARRADIREQVYAMNATQILLECARGREHADFAKYWRTRNGTADEHTSFCIAYNLCLAARKAGAEVDYSLVWNAGHGDVDGDGTGSFLAWVHHICGRD